MSAHISPYSISLVSVLASVIDSLDSSVREICQEYDERICNCLVGFLARPISPESTLEMERQLKELLRQQGQQLMELTLNLCEPESPQDAPHDVQFEAGGYRRLRDKKPNRFVETTFGRITLNRRGYRYWHRGTDEKTIFPVELILGLTQGATPALAGEIARKMAEAGATQERVLEQCRREFGLSMSVQRLRDLVEEVSQGMERHRHEYQLCKLLELLQIADSSRGRYKPTISVGRDGIMLPIRGGKYKEGCVGTIAVFDRSGNRLGTVYLAHEPESKQPQLTAELKALVEAVLKEWCLEQGKPLPRLCYITDAGDAECEFYEKVLSRMRDPRDSSKYLHWQRIIDYYHTTTKITLMAEALFGPGEKASSWARKMRKLLLKPGGVSRVLHSAAAMKSYWGIKSDRKKEFATAYDYIRRRSTHMQYYDFRATKLPIGSGVTEAACKTVFTERLKLSGMTWGNGAQSILNLRVVLLSGLWDTIYAAHLRDSNPVELRPYHKNSYKQRQKAA